MADIQVIKNTTLCLSIVNINITMDNGDRYVISESDKIFFTVKDIKGNAVMQKRFPGDIDLINGSLVIKILPQDTDNLKCLEYRYDCKIMLKGNETDIYTLLSGGLEVLPTVTDLNDMVPA
jgi:hypothetical protein